MSALNEKAPSVCGAQGFGYHSFKPQITAICADTQENRIAPECGKSFAMWLYNFGMCDFEITQCAFNQRPDWRHA